MIGKDIKKSEKAAMMRIFIYTAGYVERVACCRQGYSNILISMVII